MRLHYWIADRLDDSRCYSIRAKTRKEVLAQLKEIEAEPFMDDDEACYRTRWGAKYRLPHKVTIEYKDGFDLVNMALSEGGIE